jgi:acetate kinase
MYVFTSGNLTNMKTLLVVNAGSSCCKLQVFEVPSLISLEKHNISPGEAKKKIKELIHQYKPIAIGHRVVHGGTIYSKPMLVNIDVILDIANFIRLAPLHQPANIEAIENIFYCFPEISQVACFDTAFHSGHNPVVTHYAIPEKFYEKGIQRYGFHGLSYEYVSDYLKTYLPRLYKDKVIIAHLGSGCSMCAVKNGKSIDSTMGFTALDGLTMGTRCGQIDPGVVLFMCQKLGTEEVEKILYKESGLKGLSGISNDMRELEKSTDPHAAFAIDCFAYRAALNAGMLITAMGGIDGFVFTGGIGENSALVRKRIIERLSWLGVNLEAKTNRENNKLISSPDSAFPVYVIPTNEELMIAKHTLNLIKQGKEQ